MAEQNKFLDSVSTARYSKGQEVSNNVESGFLGWAQLFLLLTGVALAYGESSFVAWLMPEMPGGTWKMMGINTAILLIGIRLPVQLSFRSQVGIFKADLDKQNKNKEIDINLYASTLQDINAWKWKSMAIVLFSIIVLCVVHGAMIWFMQNVFSSEEHMDKLGIAENAMAYRILGISFPLMAVVLHIYLGLLTKVRMDMNDLFPKYAEKMKIQVGKVNDKHFQLAVLDTERSVINLQKEIDKKEEELIKLRASVTPPTPPAGGGGGGGTPPPSAHKGFDASTPPTALEASLPGLKSRINQLFPILTDQYVSTNAMNTFLGKLTKDNLYGTVGMELTQIAKDVTDLYTEGISKWSNAADKKRIWAAIVAEKVKFKNIYDKHK